MKLNLMLHNILRIFLRVKRPPGFCSDFLENISNNNHILLKDAIEL